MSGCGAQCLARIRFPREWMDGSDWLPGFPEIAQAFTYDRAPGERFFLAGGVRSGGANLLGLAWSTGFHLARCAPPSWAIEERVDPNAPACTRVLWREVIEGMIAGHRATAAKFGRPS